MNFSLSCEVHDDVPLAESNLKLTVIASGDLHDRVSDSLKSRTFVYFSKCTSAKLFSAKGPATSSFQYTILRLLIELLDKTRC